MGKAVHYCVGDRWLSNDIVPHADRDLSGDDRAQLVVPVVEQLEQGKSVIGIQWCESEIVDDEQACFCEALDLVEVATVGSG